MASSRVRAPELDGFTAGSYVDLLPADYAPFRWVGTRVLWSARRDTFARTFGDPSLRRRRRLVRGVASFTIDRTELSTPSFVVLGDTGEGDGSQYCVVPALRRVAGDTDFMVIASDVIYPAGGIREYERKFFRPYAEYPAPILAVPGNHDWYDGLRGFMWCFVEGRGARPASQPGPYWCLDTGPLRIIGVDTGILGRLDSDQLAWVRRVSSERDVSKLLVTGTPLVANGRVHRDDPLWPVVAAPESRFVAVIAGDVHNYQRRQVDGVVHIVSGGGGAYMNATHTIPRVDDEDAFRLFPLRGDSLAWFSRRFEAWARTRTRDGTRLIQESTLEPDVAAAVMAERLGLEPVRDSARRLTPSDGDRAAAARVYPPDGMRGLNRWADQYYDTDDPPFFKHLVRCDCMRTELRVRCFAATGRAEDEADPPLEDEVRIGLL
jgi:hypothetical protein